ncbi:MAG: hypothetical protein KKG75_02235 [Nanoarchaeota archaeon]|nr:hypothetical protein [Nanoarchaeota archaeon]
MAKVVNKPSEETIKGIVGRKIPEVLSQEEIDAVLGSGPAEDFSANDDLEDIFPDEEALALAGWVETDENRNKFLTELGLTGFMDELYGLYERYRNELW